MNADIDSMDTKHEPCKRARFMRFNKTNDRRSRIGESLIQEATVLPLTRDISIFGPMFTQGAGRAVLRCRSNRTRVLRLYRGCKVTGTTSISTRGFWEWSGLACYPAVRTTWRSDHSTTATT